MVYEIAQVTLGVLQRPGHQRRTETGSSTGLADGLPSGDFPDSRGPKRAGCGRHRGGSSRFEKGRFVTRTRPTALQLVAAGETRVTDGTMWFVTYGGGQYYRNGRWRALRTPRPTSDVVFESPGTPMVFLWISTNQGIARAPIAIWNAVSGNPRRSDGRFGIAMNEKQGMQRGNPAVLRSATGLLWFATVQECRSGSTANHLHPLPPPV